MFHRLSWIGGTGGTLDRRRESAASYTCLPYFHHVMIGEMVA